MDGEGGEVLFRTLAPLSSKSPTATALALWFSSVPWNVIPGLPREAMYLV